MVDGGHGAVISSQPVAGGCINHGTLLTTTTGARFFLKTNASAPASMFEREAEGLAALAAAPGGPRVPQMHIAGPDYLLLESLAPEAPAPDYWPTLGRKLAHLHLTASNHFGFARDNFIGLTPQPNPRDEDGHVFFAEHRLLHLGRLCLDGGRLGSRSLVRLEKLAARLPELIPQQPASLLHGDLWSGNVIPGPEGEACLIDPAAHYGWAEADLAMLTLFGSPPAALFAAYEEARPLARGYRERFEVYNLYHLLNHLYLFGGGYAEAVEAVLKRKGCRMKAEG